jgi:hypothetical protein
VTSTIGSSPALVTGGGGFLKSGAATQIHLTTPVRAIDSTWFCFLYPARFDHGS